MKNDERVDLDKSLEKMNKITNGKVEKEEQGKIMFVDKDGNISEIKKGISVFFTNKEGKKGIRLINTGLDREETEKLFWALMIFADSIGLLDDEEGEAENEDK